MPPQAAEPPRRRPARPAPAATDTAGDRRGPAGPRAGRAAGSAPSGGRHHRAGWPDDPTGPLAMAAAPTAPPGAAPAPAPAGTRTPTRRGDESGAGPGDGQRLAHRPGHGLGHGHGHGHGPADPAGRRVRVLLAALLGPCLLAALVGLVLLWPTTPAPRAGAGGTPQPVAAQVVQTLSTRCDAAAPTPSPARPQATGQCVAVTVHMTDGPRAGHDLVQVVPIEPGTPRFAIGDAVVLGWSGGNPDDPGSYQIVDFQRGGPLWWLAGLFALAVLALGRWRGLAALAALGLSFVVLVLFVLPAILAGRDPLWVAVVGSCLIMFAVLYLSHGPSARTSTAVLGTLVSLLLIGVLGSTFTALARLTGLDDTTDNLIAALGVPVDARGLLLAGVVIGALGVLDDVTVTQTSAVWELHRADPAMGARALFAAGMRIGRDHVSSAVNTLVLAYAGAALPLLLTFSISGRGLGDVLTSQDVATEIVRTLVGSIGLVASVPVTTGLAAVVARREAPPA